MNIYMKILLLILMIVYAVSPVDLAPGAVDDLLIVIIGLVASRKLSIRG